jgi:lytic cellulose monooxygenase (C1-hydroxylating)
VQSDDIACNVNGSIVPSGVDTIAANEGDKIIVNWDISSHPGPITHFLFGPVDDAAQATGIGAGWFKIDELDYQNGTWANEVVGNNGGNYSFSLPTGLESGDYLVSKIFMIPNTGARLKTNTLNSSAPKCWLFTALIL